MFLFGRPCPVNLYVGRKLVAHRRTLFLFNLPADFICVIQYVGLKDELGGRWVQEMGHYNGVISMNTPRHGVGGD